MVVLPTISLGGESFSALKPPIQRAAKAVF
jgi:hypothetical protein